jgi:hypothetical protein
MGELNPLPSNGQEKVEPETREFVNDNGTPQGLQQGYFKVLTQLFWCKIFL